MRICNSFDCQVVLDGVDATWHHAHAAVTQRTIGARYIHVVLHMSSVICMSKLCISKININYVNFENQFKNVTIVRFFIIRGPKYIRKS